MHDFLGIESVTQNLMPDIQKMEVKVYHIDILDAIASLVSRLSLYEHRPPWV